MRCHFIPVIRKQSHCLFLLPQTKLENKWQTFNDLALPDEGFYSCALRAALEGTYGSLCDEKNMLAKTKNIFLELETLEDKYFCVEMTTQENYIEYLNNLLTYKIKNTRFIHPDDFYRCRWFSIDEILSFKNVSPELVSLLSEHSHMFHNGPH